MMCVENYLLARGWYVAQIFPPHGDSLRQIRLAIAWYIWSGDIFRVPLTTLCMTRETGGWNLTHMETKCRALLINRLQIQSEIEGSVTNWWLNRWRLKHHSANPPHLARIPKQLEYCVSWQPTLHTLTPEDRRKQSKNSEGEHMKCFETY